jgi:hypothetical protein
MAHKGTGNKMFDYDDDKKENPNQLNPNEELKLAIDNGEEMSSIESEYDYTNDYP